MLARGTDRRQHGGNTVDTPGGAARLRCYDSASTDVMPSALDAAPQLCFIDGEHTDAAAIADFVFRGYLASLRANDPFREFANREPFHLYRRLRRLVSRP